MSASELNKSDCEVEATTTVLAQVECQLATLAQSLQATPEFAAGGFVLKPSRDGLQMQILRGRSMRGTWSVHVEGLRWRPFGASRVGAPVDCVAAVRTTMMMVLQNLQLRRLLGRQI